MAVAMRQRFAFPLEIAAKSFSCSRVTSRQPEATHAQFVSKKKREKEYLTSALSRDYRYRHVARALRLLIIYERRSISVYKKERRISGQLTRFP